MRCAFRSCMFSIAFGQFPKTRLSSEKKEHLIQTMSISSLEFEFDLMWDELFPDLDLETEVRLIPKRRFKFDYVNFAAKVAIEINGQIWHKGGHSTGKSLMRDYEKLNLAQQHGYCVFQLSREMITETWLKAIAATIRTRRLELLPLSKMIQNKATVPNQPSTMANH